MEFENYTCNYTQADNLSKLVHKLAINTNDPAYFLGYSSNPQVMLNIYYKAVLEMWLGLRYYSCDTSRQNFQFKVVNKEKFVFARLKYGI